MMRARSADVCHASDLALARNSAEPQFRSARERGPVGAMEKSASRQRFNPGALLRKHPWTLLAGQPNGGGYRRPGSEGSLTWARLTSRNPNQTGDQICTAALQAGPAVRCIHPRQLRATRCRTHRQPLDSTRGDILKGRSCRTSPSPRVEETWSGAEPLRRGVMARLLQPASGNGHARSHTPCVGAGRPSEAADVAAQARTVESMEPRTGSAVRRFSSGSVASLLDPTRATQLRTLLALRPAPRRAGTGAARGRARPSIRGRPDKRRGPVPAQR